MPEEDFRKILEKSKFFATPEDTENFLTTKNDIKTIILVLRPQTRGFQRPCFVESLFLYGLLGPQE